MPVATKASPNPISLEDAPLQRDIRRKQDTDKSEKVATLPGDPSHEEIAYLAYSYWEAGGCLEGTAEEDWLRAETELRHQGRT